MPNGLWGGDLNAAKEFQSQVHRGLGEDRRGRGGNRGGRGGSSMVRSGNSFANTSSFTDSGNSRGNGLLKELPSRFWEPANNHSTQNNQATNTEDRGDPMNIDDRNMGGSRWASDTRTTADGPAAQNGTGSAPTPASWGITAQPAPVGSGFTPAPRGSTDSSRDVPSRAAPIPVRISAPKPSHPTNTARDRAVSPPRGLDISAHAAVNNTTNEFGASGTANAHPATGQEVTWGPHNTPVSNIQPFNSPARDFVTDQRMKDVQNGKTPPQSAAGADEGMTSAIEAGHQWPGLKASIHAGPASFASRPNSTGQKQQSGPRRDLLQANGMLKGVQFTEDQGPQQDDDWLKTYNLNKVKDKCVSVAKQAFAASDHEAEKALRKVIHACNQVLRAKNEVKDKKLEDEADKVLSKSQNEAWLHWIKFYHPTAPAASSSIQAPNESPNVQMQDAPAFVPPQNVQAQVQRGSSQTQSQPQPQAFPATGMPFTSAQAPQRLSDGGADSGGFDPVSFQQQSTLCTAQGGDFGSCNSPQLHKPAIQQTQIPFQKPTSTAQFGGHNPSAGFGSANALQASAPAQKSQPAQRPQATKPTELTGLPSMFPQGLPAGFDDPQARKIFEDFFFQNKRLPQK